MTISILGMRRNACDNYFENEVLSADPLKRVVLLYHGALDSVTAARRHLAQGDVRARARSIGKAIEILAELSQSLDMMAGGELSVQLSRLYEYVMRLLMEANVAKRMRLWPKWSGC